MEPVVLKFAHGEVHVYNSKPSEDRPDSTWRVRSEKWDILKLQLAENETFVNEEKGDSHTR